MTAKNPPGRKKGVQNKVSGTLKNRISLLIDKNWRSIQTDIETLTPKDRLTFLTNLLSYAVPKMTATTNDVSIQSTLESLNTDQLQKVVDQILLEDGAN